MSVHKAAFFWNNKTKRQQVTACGKVDYTQPLVKVVDWAEVTCKYCLRIKDQTPDSTTSL
jgi:hypothetical protein